MRRENRERASRFAVRNTPTPPPVHGLATTHGAVAPVGFPEGYHRWPRSWVWTSLLRRAPASPWPSTPSAKDSPSTP